MQDIQDFLWVVENLDDSENFYDWKQSLATIAFMTTEPYGKGLKEKLLIPYLKKALSKQNIKIKKLALRFILSLKSFDVLTSQDLDKDLLAETVYEKYIKSEKQDFLRPLKTTFMKLQREKKLQKFLNELGQGEFSQDIVRELVFQLSYRDVHKMEEALEILDFLFKKMGIKREPFIPFLKEFSIDLDERIYLSGKKEIKGKLKNKAYELINF